MNWKISGLILFIFLPFWGYSQHVYFGERNLSDTKNALYLDENGYPYPRFLISDSSMQRAGGNLASWYHSNPNELNTIAAIYSLKNTATDSLISLLNQAIFKDECSRINALDANTVTILVHGYRKSFHKIQQGLSAGEEFNCLEQKLDSLQLQTTCYVEIYWDGTYDCCYSADLKRNRELFQQFDRAQFNALKVGNSLRSYISSLSCTQLNIIGHSLGAKVVMSSLINLTPSSLPTPTFQYVNIGLIAPAIGGIETFKHYYERNSTIHFESQDNYRLYVMYNPADFVLHKKDDRIGLIGPGAKAFGTTAFGCDYHHEVRKVQQLFEINFPNSSWMTQNMQHLGKKHSLKYYAQSTYLSELVTWMNATHVEKETHN